MTDVARNQRDWRQMLLTFGPGLVVMLANTEVGSVITAAQSGAKWGYRLLLLQLLIIPLLFAVQELAARLALGTGVGYSELIRQNFGRSLTFVSITALAVSCFGTLVTQMAGFTLERRLTAPDGKEARSIAERRRVLEWRIATASQNDVPLFPWSTNALARARIAEMRAAPREEDVDIAILRKLRLPLEPPEGRP